MEYKFQEIGTFFCEELYRYDTPRQGVFANENIGYIQLNSRANFEQALDDLGGVQRLWIIFVFNQNKGWKPKVNPPVANGHKIGLFATRSPHRPNSIGLSCVELLKVEGLKVYVKNFDLLNNTPILDIKPYIPVADAFVDSKVAWLDSSSKEVYSLQFDPNFIEQSSFIYENCNLDVENFCKVQLSINPLDKSRKRVRKIDKNSYEIAFRNWRIYFVIEGEIICVNSIKSGYSNEDLNDLTIDKYKDKKNHQKFMKNFY